MELAVLFSGGKDSCFSLFEVLREGHNVKYLVTIIPRNPESYMFHYPNIRLTSLQAGAMGIRHVTRESSGKKEKELRDLERALIPLRRDLDGLVAGGIASKYQADRIGKICHGLGLKFLSPLWRIEPNRYWRMLLKSGFRVMITGVACQGLDEEWLGRIMDPQALKKLKALSKKFKFHLSGEGGEFETLVLDCPLFKKRLKILEAEKVWNGDSGLYRIKRAELAGKHPKE